MAAFTVAILSPGEMGHHTGRALVEEGVRVVTCLEGRSERTQALCAQAGIEPLADLQAVVSEADLVLSILPPSAAMECAQAVVGAMRAVGRTPPFAECNPTSPRTIRAIADTVTGAGAGFVDAGIVGWAPGLSDRPTRFFACGPAAAAMEMIDGPKIRVVDLGPEIGRASAVKTCYAAVTKGTWSLQLAALMAGRVHGVSEALLEEFALSRADEFEGMKRVLPRLPANAHRWVGEMHEIADTFAAAWITPDFHNGAADIFELLAKTSIALETPETVDRTRDIEKTLEILIAELDLRLTAD